MKKLITISLLLAVLTTYGQSFNNEITSGEKYAALSGKINKDGLESGSYADWFQKNFESYQPKQNIINLLKNELPNYTIKAFMGTWCGDSKREVPKFYKVLEAANFPLDRLTMVAVDRSRDTYKQSPGGEEEGMLIHRVPTFIVYKDGKELNRIVEEPVVTIEEDLLRILRNEYIPNYHGVTLANKMLSEMGVEKFSKKQKKIVGKLKEVIKSYGELSTYSSVLFYADQQEEAIAVARLNLAMYPKESRTYIGLGNKLRQMGDSSEALKIYQKALELNPENEKLKTTISEMTTK
ncbi:MAG: tetratricopeptide repeat protein [Flavobacteriaceae bacterium]|nr:tetratricopeptide repeat protein [Flavobacteriaceae bacterium]